MFREGEESCNKESGTRREDRGRLIPRGENRIYERLGEIIYYLTRNKMLIKCLSCGKEIQQRGRRTLCIACSNKRDKEIAKIYREAHKEEIRTKNRERARQKTEKLKWGQ